MEDFAAVKNKKSQFFRVFLIMLFYEKGTIVQMSLEIGMNSGTAILFVSVIIYAINDFLIDFVPPPMIHYE